MTEWKMKRGDTEYPATSLAELRQWALKGNLVGSDYVFNPTLSKWMYARELEELKASFPAGKNGNTLIAVGAVLLAMGLFIPKAWLFMLLGVVVLVVGVVRR